MEYNKLVAVSGMPGLFELVSSRPDGGILRSLDDNKTQFVSSRMHNFSHLESIEIFTTGENINLVEIFKAMEDAGVSLPDTKDNGLVKKYFEKVYPEMDFERVYASDMKKIIRWFESLRKHKVEIKLTEVPEEESEEAVEVEEKPAPKAKKKTEKKEKEVKPAKSSKSTTKKKKGE